MKKTFITISILVVVFLVVAIPQRYLDIFETDFGYIYHPQTDNLYTYERARHLNYYERWKYLIPFLTVKDGLRYELDCIYYAGKLKNLIEESTKPYDAEKIAENIGDLTIKMKENRKKSIMHEYFLEGYFQPIWDYTKEDLSKMNEKLIDVLKIEVSEAGYPIDLIITHRRRTFYKDTGEFKNSASEIEILNKALLIDYENRRESYNEMRSIVFSNSCDSFQEIIHED